MWVDGIRVDGEKVGEWGGIKGGALGNPVLVRVDFSGMCADAGEPRQEYEIVSSFSNREDVDGDGHHVRVVIGHQLERFGVDGDDAQEVRSVR